MKMLRSRFLGPTAVMTWPLQSTTSMTMLKPFAATRAEAMSSLKISANPEKFRPMKCSASTPSAG